MTANRTSLLALVAAAGVLSILTGCATIGAALPGSRAQANPTPTVSDAIPEGVARVTGYAVGEVPAIPILRLPDLTFQDESYGGLGVSLSRELGSLDGADLRPAQCDTGVPVARRGGDLLYGGSATATPTPAAREAGFILNGIPAVLDSDGSGSYQSRSLELWSDGEGAGSWSDPQNGTEIWVSGDGAGTSQIGPVEINVYGNGAGDYRNSETGVEINNYGHGAGDYRDSAAEITVINYGDGTGTVNGIEVPMEPLAPVVAVGKFPALGTLRPVDSCGSLLSLSDELLFDVDAVDLRDGANAVLARIATELAARDIPSAEVIGHSDAGVAEGDALSAQRAQAVAQRLTELGAPTQLSAAGRGSRDPVVSFSNPLAADPACRALNQRVEILIPQPVAESVTVDAAPSVGG